MTPSVESHRPNPNFYPLLETLPSVVSAPPRFRGDSPVEFTSYLAELKQRGCNLLVTGEVCERATRQATRRLLGSAAERRRRVLVLTDHAGSDGGAYLPHGVDPDDEDVAVIPWNTGARSAATVQVTLTDQDADLADLRDEIRSTIARLDAAADGFAPAELRLGVVTVGLLLDRYDRDDVRDLLDAVTARVRNVHGMGHYHLPVPDDADAVAALDDLFDARIELRRSDAVTTEQRWHVPEYGTTTWVTL